MTNFESLENRILIASSSPMDRHFLSAALRKCRCQVTAVDDSDQALALALNLRPRVVILSTGLSGRFDTRSMVARLRANPVTACCRLVVVANPGSDFWLDWDGVMLDCLIEKPFSPIALRECVNAWLDD